MDLMIQVKTQMSHFIITKVVQRIMSFMNKPNHFVVLVQIQIAALAKTICMAFLLAINKCSPK